MLSTLSVVINHMHHACIIFVVYDNRVERVAQNSFIDGLFSLCCGFNNVLVLYISKVHRSSMCNNIIILCLQNYMP